MSAPWLWSSASSLTSSCSSCKVIPAVHPCPAGAASARSLWRWRGRPCCCLTSPAAAWTPMLRCTSCRPLSRWAGTGWIQQAASCPGQRPGAGPGAAVRRSRSCCLPAQHRPAHALQSRAAPCITAACRWPAQGVSSCSPDTSPLLPCLLCWTELTCWRVGSVCLRGRPPLCGPDSRRWDCPVLQRRRLLSTCLRWGGMGGGPVLGLAVRRTAACGGAVCRWVAGTGGTRAKARTTLATTSPLQPATLCPGGQRPAAAGPAAASGKQA